MVYLANRINKYAASDEEHREGKLLAKQILAKFSTAEEASKALGVPKQTLVQIATGHTTCGKKRLALLRTLSARVGGQDAQ